MSKFCSLYRHSFLTLQTSRTGIIPRLPQIYQTYLWSSMSSLCHLWFTWISSSGLPTWFCFYENNHLTAPPIGIRNCFSNGRQNIGQGRGTALLLPLVPVNWGNCIMTIARVYRTNYFGVLSLILQRPGPGLMGISMFTLRHLAHISVSSTLSSPTSPSHIPFVYKRAFSYEYRSAFRFIFRLKVRTTILFCHTPTPVL